jgi:hypothetical protein
MTDETISFHKYFTETKNEAEVWESFKKELKKHQRLPDDLPEFVEYLKNMAPSITLLTQQIHSKVLLELGFDTKEKLLENLHNDELKFFKGAKPEQAYRKYWVGYDNFFAQRFGHVNAYRKIEYVAKICQAEKSEQDFIAEEIGVSTDDLLKVFRFIRDMRA